MALPSEEDQAIFTANSAENFVFGCVVLEICEQTDRQIYRHTDSSTLHPRCGRSRKRIVVNKHCIIFVNKHHVAAASEMRVA